MSVAASSRQTAIPWLWHPLPASRVPSGRGSAKRNGQNSIHVGTFHVFRNRYFGHIGRMGWPDTFPTRICRLRTKNEKIVKAELYLGKDFSLDYLNAQDFYISIVTVLFSFKSIPFNTASCKDRPFWYQTTTVTIYFFKKRCSTCTTASLVAISWENYYGGVQSRDMTPAAALAKPI